MLEVLDEWQEHSKKIQAKAHKKGNGGLIFPNRFGDIRSYDGFRRQFQRFLSENGLGGDGVTFHKFRHTFATYLMELGVNPRVVQELLGHKDIETTLAIYTSVSSEVMEKEVAKLSAKLEGIRNNTYEDTNVRHNLIVAG